MLLIIRRKKKVLSVAARTRYRLQWSRDFFLLSSLFPRNAERENKVRDSAGSAFDVTVGARRKFRNDDDDDNNNNIIITVIINITRRRAARIVVVLLLFSLLLLLITSIEFVTVAFKQFADPSRGVRSFNGVVSAFSRLAQILYAMLLTSKVSPNCQIRSMIVT